MLDDGHLTPPKTPSDTDSNSNSGSLFSRRYPDELSSNSSGSKENTPSLQNNENLLSPKLPSQRRVFNGFSPENFKCQPKLTRRNSIDLSINGEKSNSDDEWFAQRFKPNRRKEPKNYQISHRVTRTDVQKCLRMRLAEMRRRDQQKRKAMYDADNGIVDDESESAEIDICKLMNDEESKALECDFGEKSLENNAVVKEKDVKPKYDLMRHEADESNDDDRETFIQEYEVNEKKRSIENRNNEIEEEIAEKNGSIYLNEGLNEVVAEDNDDKFVSKENIFDEDLRKDWLQTGTKTYESLMEHKDHENCYLSDNEATSSNLSDEKTDIELIQIVDSEEDNRSSTSLIDRLLDDVAANCSGSFDSPEDNKPDEHKKVPIDNSDDDDRDDEDEDELIRRHRKPRKRRLLFTPDDSDEDKDNEDKDALKSIKNVRNLEADDRNDIETSSISNQKKTNSIDDVNALLNESDEFNVNKQDSFLFSDEDDDHKRNVIEPIDEVNDENQQVEGVEEANSSDDELKIFRELERAQKAKKKSEYIDEEASLSGDDVGSDENDDEDQLNVYEAEEGDNDELPDDETIREQLHKQWLKQQQDEEDRKLLYWKDQLLIDGDLTEETDRTFRFKLRVTENENTNEEMDDVAVDAENIEVDDDEVCKRRREISKWKIETKKTELHGESTLLKKTNPLLKAASKIIDKGNLNGNSQSDEQADALVCKNSLLYHRKSLSQVLNQTKITLYTKSAETSNARANEHTKEQNA